MESSKAMGFRGLENFGQGIARYGDLMAQGYKDQEELKDRDLRNAKELDQQRLNDAVKVQEAAKSGLFYDRPDLFQKYGGSMVPETDLSSIGGAAPSTPMSPDRSPAVVGGAEMAPAPNVLPSGDSQDNAPMVLNGHYQNALQSIGQQAPGTVDLKSGYVHPYAAQMARELALKKYEADQKLALAGIVNQGKNYRAATYGAQAPGGILAKVAQNRLSALSQMERDLQDPKKSLLMTAKQKEDQQNAINSERGELNESLGHMAAGKAAATAPKSTSKPDGKYYSSSANKTYTYQGGQVVKVEDGHT